MASNDPGFAQAAAPAEDPIKGAIYKDTSSGDLKEEDRPVAPDQFDPKYETTKKEIWAWYGF